jgi:hypothetical protein
LDERRIAVTVPGKIKHGWAPLRALQAVFGFTAYGPAEVAAAIATVGDRAIRKKDIGAFSASATRDRGSQVHTVSRAGVLEKITTNVSRSNTLSHAQSPSAHWKNQLYGR